MLQEIINQHPEKYQPYDLLAQLLDEGALALARANQLEPAKVEFAKAAANYEQSLLINPIRGNTCLRLAELLIGPLKESERAVQLLIEARQRFPNAPEFTYYLALALREAKHSQQSVTAFEEALNEAQGENERMLSARFYFDYGAAADQAGLYDKAADLLRKSIVLANIVGRVGPMLRRRVEGDGGDQGFLGPKLAVGIGIGQERRAPGATSVVPLSILRTVPEIVAGAAPLSRVTLIVATAPERLIDGRRPAPFSG